ncbi:HAD family phosphatase [Fusobacterium sp.]|uniref:HAD family hydrolase n=1 Tax=Fusobacterium sp. TaxID=68766 RepID=UPI0025C48088|nr:HAD family phosphatase [Fusobacterium sp.]
MLKLVIFDMDGVILDSERVANLAWFQVNEKYDLGLNIEKLKEIKGGTAVRTLEVLSKQVGKTLAEKIMEEKKEIQMSIIKKENGIKLKEGVVELLKYIKEKGLKCIVATSTTKERAEKQLKETGVYGYFDNLVYGDEIKNGKPDPEIFLKACEKIGVSPIEAVVIEDSVLGATAANRAGIKCFVVEDTMKFSVEENRLTTRKYTSLLEVVGNL